MRKNAETAYSRGFEEKEDTEVTIDKQGHIWVLVSLVLINNIGRVFIVPDMATRLQERGVNPPPSEKTVKLILDEMCKLFKIDGKYVVVNLGRSEKRVGVKSTYNGYVCRLRE